MSVRVIAVLNSKGGSGKSTLATNLARSIQLRGKDVLLVDSDPQGTARDWRDMQDEEDFPPVVGMDRATLHKDLKKVSDSFDHIVIDGAARLQEIVASAVKASDLVLIPVQPSAADLWATEGLIELIQTRQQVTGGKPQAAFVVSRQIVGTTLAGEIGDVLEEYGVPMLEGRTSQRVAYTEALNLGLSVLDLNGAEKAASEIRMITDEVLQWQNEEV